MNKNEIIKMKEDCIKGLNRSINAQLMLIEMVRAGVYTYEEAEESFVKLECSRLGFIISYKQCKELLDILV